MVRRLELIGNKKERQKAFLRGKSVLMKKAHELSVLCDVKVGMMIFSAQDCDDHQKPLIWPENSQEIHFLIDSYKKSGESFINNGRRNCDSSKVLNHQIQKAKTELVKLKQKNDESRRPRWDHQLDTLSSQELVQFSGVLENKIQEIRFRADVIKEYLTYFAKRSSVTPQFLANQKNMIESRSDDVWQPMNPPPQSGVDFEMPSYNSFGGNLDVVPMEEMGNYGYGQALIQHCTPEMSYCAPAMQQLQAQVASPSYICS